MTAAKHVARERWTHQGTVTIDAMHCPFCGADDTRVIDSRLVAGGEQVRRRRACQHCDERFTTYETFELWMPHVVKSDGAREPFNEDKLRAGLAKALEKRPVSVEDLETTVSQILYDLRASGEREIRSRQVGEAVMAKLKGLDQVAYVRFASVYRDFQDISAFQDEIARLETERDHAAEATLPKGQRGVANAGPVRAGDVATDDKDFVPTGGSGPTPRATRDDRNRLASIES